MVNDSNIITIDSIESKMKVNKFSGNHSQKTREGYNLWDYLNVVKASAGGLTIEKDYENGYITVNGTPNENYVYISSSIFITDMLEDGQRYTLWQEIYGGEGTTDGIYLQVTRTADNETTVRYYSRNNSASFLVDKSNNASYSITLQTSSVDGTGTLTNYRNRYMLYKGTDEKSYELPGASPSLDYPSEVKAVGDNVNILPNNAVSTSHNGVNYTINEDGSIYAVGTATSNSQVILAGQLSSTEEIMKLRKGVQYKNVGNVDIIYRDTNLDYARLQEGNILTVDENVSVGCFYLQVNSGTTVDETYYPKLVEYYEGMDESYSPYGQGSVEVTKSNNYSNFSHLANGQSSGNYNGLTFEMLNKFSCRISGKPVSSELRFGNNYNSTTILVKLEKNKKYKIKNSLNSASEITLVNSKNNTYRMIYLANKTEITLQEEEDGISSVRIYVDVNKTYDNEIVDCVIYTQEDDDFIPKETEYTLLIQKPMLSGDYFVKETDGWKEVHTFGYVNTREVENLGVSLNTSNGEFRRYNAHNLVTDRKSGEYLKILCTHFKRTDSRWHENEGICGWETGQSFCIGTFNTNYDTVDKMKTFLQQNDVGIYYELATSTKLDCTEEQITVLNQLQNIILYDDTTNIILPDVYPILDYDVSKIIDTTTTFEASLDSNGYFVVPDYDIKCLVSYSESDIPSMPEAVETAVSVPGRDGDIPLNTTYNPIPFNIVCYTEDNLTPEEKYAEETKMNKFLNSIKNNTIKLKLESKGKYYDVKYNGQLTTINYPKHLQFSIPLKSSSSYAKDIDEYYILGNGEEESDTIKEVGAIFVIEGPAQTPKISLNDYEMFYDNVLLSNTKLVIDSNKSTVTMINREGTATNAMRYYNHEFPKIQNGNNVLKVLSGIDEDRQVNVRWFDLKL